MVHNPPDNVHVGAEKLPAPLASVHDTVPVGGVLVPACERDGGGECGRTKSMSRIRIADDPDSWGSPQISSIEPVKPREDPSKCAGCGVEWKHHLADLCPIAPRTSID